MALFSLIRLGVIIPALPYKCTGGIKWPQRPACHRHRALVCRLSGSRETHRVHCYSYHLHTVFYCAFFTSLRSTPPPLQCLWCQTGVSTGQGNCLFFFSLSFCLSEDKTTWPQALCSLAYREKCQERSCVRACMHVCLFFCRLQGKVVKKRKK